MPYGKGSYTYKRCAKCGKYNGTKYKMCAPCRKSVQKQLKKKYK